MENSDYFDAYRDVQDYSTIWDMDEFTDLDAEVVPHPKPVILYPYYSQHFERMLRVSVRPKSNKLRDVWAAIEQAHIETGDWHQFIESIAPCGEDKYQVFVGS